MNKLMGFYELRELNIPTVPWKRFAVDVNLDDNLLWTIRVALNKGMDINLPRVVGVRAAEAKEKGMLLLDRYQDNGMVIYYPYFIAEKSGVVEINKDYIIIEAVDKDLWNLVTEGKKDVTIKIQNGQKVYDGSIEFLKESEIQEIQKNIRIVKMQFREALSEGKSVFMEWSYAYNTDISGLAIGEHYLVFYELRLF